MPGDLRLCGRLRVEIGFDRAVSVAYDPVSDLRTRRRPAVFLHASQRSCADAEDLRCLISAAHIINCFILGSHWRFL
jgi:hypothetical protein